MYRVGQEEIDAVAKVILSGELFRYHEGGECERFEKRYAEFVGAEHCRMTSSGTAALTAVLAGLGLGPGDEIIVPAQTYMATAISVLSVGAIPIIADVDESLTLCPRATDEIIGPRTRAMIPVHMWGLPCDMDSLTAIARKRDLLVIEDACQAVGGAYEGRMLGSIGDGGAFSFNYYKNMTAGEGGALVTDEAEVAQRAACMVDCCSFYWTGRQHDFRPFAATGSRASEIEGALMNVQLDRLPSMIHALRGQKKRILKETADTPLTPAPSRSLDWECGAQVVYTLPDEDSATAFVEKVGGVIAGKTGRHVFTEWDPILDHQGAHHPDLNPYNLPQNQECRREYPEGMCERSLDILSRTVMIANHPDRSESEVSALIDSIRQAAAEVLG